MTVIIQRPIDRWEQFDVRFESLGTCLIIATNFFRTCQDNISIKYFIRFAKYHCAIYIYVVDIHVYIYINKYIYIYICISYVYV